MTATRSSLLSRVRDLTDARSWAEFDKLYRPLLADYARGRGVGREDAEEIAQQCLAAIVGRIQHFHRNKSFRGWLRKMADHKVSDLLADRRKRHAADAERLSQVPEAPSPPNQLWERQWNDTHLRCLIEWLRADFAEHTLQAFELYVLHEYPVEKISHLLGMTPNQIYVAKNRVMQRLQTPRYRELLNGLYDGGL